MATKSKPKMLYICEEGDTGLTWEEVLEQVEEGYIEDGQDVEVYQYVGKKIVYIDKKVILK